MKRVILAGMLLLALPQDGVSFSRGPECVGDQYLEGVLSDGKLWDTDGMLDVLTDLRKYFYACKNPMGEVGEVFHRFMGKFNEFYQVDVEGNRVVELAKEKTPSVDIPLVNKENYLMVLETMESETCERSWGWFANRLSKDTDTIVLAVIFALLCATAIILAIFAPVVAPAVAGVLVRAICLMVK